MTHLTETRAEAWARREAQRGEVDFTMMYVGHDAFCRDLDRLLAAAEEAALLTPEAHGTWELFSRMLHLHHGAEDLALWPRLRAAVTAAEDVAILDAMEAEHAAIDPVLDAITAAYAQSRAGDIARDVEDLSSSLRAHMLHEETKALPLLERTLGAEGWAAFGEEMHSSAGMREAARMLPWSLDGASPSSVDSILRMLPGPVRVLHRHLWEPRYQRARILH